MAGVAIAKVISTFKQLLEVFKQQKQHELSVNSC